MLTGRFPDPVAIRLPRGGTATFPLALAELSGTAARAGVVKDAGDDPDITHGALIIAETAWGAPGSGVGFAAGEGVGTVTRAGLSLAVGEPAINPAPRALIRDMLIDAAAEADAPSPDITVTIFIPGGVSLAEKTMNARLGIVGGLSILGTTGIIVPYSCASWIHSIHRGIDVARAAGLGHVERLTIAGGFAKLAKLAAGHLDLHSARSQVDIAWLAGMLGELGGEPATLATARTANGAAEILGVAGELRERLARAIAGRAREVALATICGKTAVEVAIVDRQGSFLARVGG
jgi:cobalt-precorrin-5B (C1)-methyltransferase